MFITTAKRKSCKTFVRTKTRTRAIRAAAAAHTTDTLRRAFGEDASINLIALFMLAPYSLIPVLYIAVL